MENVYIRNRKNLLEKIKSESVIVIDSGKPAHKTFDEFEKYVPNRNFYYLTGLSEPNLKLMIVKGKKKDIIMLFIEETTEFMRKWVGAKISKEKASKISGIEKNRIHYLDKFEDFFRGMMTYGRGIGIAPPKNCYLDLFRVTEDEEPISHTQFRFVLDNYKELNIKNINKQISYLRMFKADFEIEYLQKAISITKLGLNRILNGLKKRTNESQLEADFIHETTLEGSEGVSFDTIAASGENATTLHYDDNNSELVNGNLILFDLGVLYNNYGSDISRTYPINGKFSERQKVLYEIVLKTNKETIEYVKPGITWNELNDFSRKILINECKSIGLIRNDEEIGKYFFHSVGHYLGLNVHDVGHYEHELVEGMIITIEPGLYISEEKIGIRIEDDILITKDGCINLSKNIIKEVKDIEEYLNKK
jgi:Xaa-Pro aminopeptidase